MLQLSADRAAGAHPYCMLNAAHTAEARALMGPAAQAPPRPEGATSAPIRRPPGPWPARAWRSTWGCRTTSTTSAAWVSTTPTSPTEEANRLLDTLVAWGSDDAVAARLKEHLDAGATEVLAQVLTAEDAAPGTPPLDAWRHAAEVLFGS